MALFGAAAALLGLAEETAVVGESMALLANEVRAEGATLLSEGGRAAYEAIATELEANQEMVEFQQALKTGAAYTAVAGAAGTAVEAGRSMAKLAGKKSLKRKRTGSQSAAQEPGSRRRRPNRDPMPPKGVSTSTHWYDRTKKKWIKRKRPLKKRPSKFKKAKKRTGAKKRTVKKTVKRKYMRALGSTKFQTHGVVSRHEVSYMGFQANGGRDEFLAGAADAVLRSIAARWKIPIPAGHQQWTYDGNNLDRPRVMKVYYRRHEFQNEGTSTNSAGEKILLYNETHDALVDTFVTELRSKARDGYMPYYMELFDHANTPANTLYADYKFGDFKVQVTNTMKIKLRNITHNDVGGHDLNSATKNPLMGKAYMFAGDVPIPKSVLEAYDGNMKKFMHDDNRRGICFGPQGVHTDATDGNQDGIDDDDGMEGAPAAGGAGDPFVGNTYMATPPTGSTVFRNCSKTHNIVMPVAREVSHTLKCAYSGTLAGICLKYSEDRYRRAPIGTCMWLGLRQKFRNSVKVNVDGTTADSHDDVTIEYDVESVRRCAGRFVRPELTPASVNLLEMNNIQP